MDNATHTLVGLMMSRAGLNRFTPRAAAVLMLAANVPDIDIVALTQGVDTYFHHHRGITHALAMAPVLAILPVAAVWMFARKALRLGAAFALSLAGVLSHLLIDYTNHYGIRLLLPWSGDWLKLNITGVVDVWIWAVLVLAVAGPGISRLVSSEIGARKTSGRGAAIFALLFVMAYDGTRWVLYQRAIQVQEGRLFEGSSPQRVVAIPSRSNPFLWTGIVDTGSAFYVGPVNLLLDFDPSAARPLYKPEQIPALDEIRRTGPFRDLLGFTDYAYWRVQPSPEGPEKVQVDAMDLRFGVPPDEAFVASAVVNGPRHVERAWFHYTAEHPTQPR
jgi:inner membrane protein